MSEDIEKDTTVSDDSEVKNSLPKLPKITDKNRKAIVFFVLFIVALFVATCAVRFSGCKAEDPSDTVLTQIKEIGVLDGVEYYYEEIKEYSNASDGFFKKQHYLVVCSGVIRAGVDLEQATVEIKEDTICITLPHAQITSNELDEDSVRYYDVLHNVFNKIDIDDIQNARKEMKDQAEQHALERGVIDAAEKSTRDVLCSVLNPFAEELDAEIEVTFIDMTEPAE